MKKQSKLLVTVLLILCLAATGWANEIEELEREAATGDPEAMYELSMVYFEENEEQPDLDRIYPLLLKAAEKGHREAFLGLFWVAPAAGKPVPLSQEKQDSLIDRFLRDGDEGIRRALAIGFMGIEGTALPLNPEKGIRIYVQDAEKEYQNSPDNADFVFSRLRAAMNDYLFIEGKIDLYEQSLLAFEKQLQSASKELKPLMSKHIIEAQIDLADAYMNGWDVPIDGDKGHQWYERAAELGSSSARITLDDLARKK